jgi:hypothetical protein
MINPIWCGMITLGVSWLIMDINFYSDNWIHRVQNLMAIQANSLRYNFILLLEMRWLKIEVGPQSYLLLIFIFVCKAI